MLGPAVGPGREARLHERREEPEPQHQKQNGGEGGAEERPEEVVVPHARDLRVLAVRRVRVSGGQAQQCMWSSAHTCTPSACCGSALDLAQQSKRYGHGADGNTRICGPPNSPWKFESVF